MVRHKYHLISSRFKRLRSFQPTLQTAMPHTSILFELPSRLVNFLALTFICWTNSYKVVRKTQNVDLIAGTFTLLWPGFSIYILCSRFTWSLKSIYSKYILFINQLIHQFHWADCAESTSLGWLIQFWYHH